MSETTTAPPTSQRLASLDAYRGFIMLLMASGGLGIAKVVETMEKAGKETGILGDIAHWTEHVPWAGGVLWDMIQPSFMFMVGVAVPYSCAKRLAQGHSWTSVLIHAFIRALVLIGLSVLIASNWDKTTSWSFTNVLGQIGLGYFFLVLLWRASRNVQIVTLATILVGFWAWFAFWPVTLVPPEMLGSMKPDDLLSGFFAHWNPHTNAAAAFDRWFLNLFPCTAPFVFNKGGYQTLNFIPSLATMLMGLMAGEWLRSAADKWRKLKGLLIAAAVCLIVGWLAGQFVCPIVKRIWTPSWVIWSAGWSYLMLAGFFVIMDCLDCKRWALPLTVVGMNSIVIYLMSQFTSSWFRETLSKHGLKEYYQGDYGPMWQRGSVLALMWLLLYWLYRQRVFLKI